MTTHLCPEIQTKLCMHKLRACETNTILHKPNAWSKCLHCFSIQLFFTRATLTLSWEKFAQFCLLQNEAMMPNMVHAPNVWLPTVLCPWCRVHIQTIPLWARVHQRTPLDDGDSNTPVVVAAQEIGCKAEIILAPPAFLTQGHFSKAQTVAVLQMQTISLLSRRLRCN